MQCVRERKRERMKWCVREGKREIETALVAPLPRRAIDTKII